MESKKTMAALATILEAEGMNIIYIQENPDKDEAILSLTGDVATAFHAAKIALDNSYELWRMSSHHKYLDGDLAHERWDLKFDLFDVNGQK